MRMCSVERRLEPLDTFADRLCAGIVGAVGQPEGDVAAAQTLCDFDGVEQVLKRVVADLIGGIAKRAELVLLILKQVGIDGAGANAAEPLERLNLADIGNTAR